ncbi:MAG: AmmeMemoRadiSam system protein A [bacterium]|nr:AmmeMemoRadiSam system protein A [bacterium]
MENKEISKTCLELARKSVENYLKEKTLLKIPEATPDFLLENKKGVFVSIFKKHNNELRGCIGTFKAIRENIAEEIIHNSLSSAFDDPRFLPLKNEELDEIYFEVSILEEPKPVKNFDELNPDIFGIIARSENGKQALLLPDIKGITTKEEQLSAICQKAGINPEEEKINLLKFKIEKFSEQ